MSDVNQLAALLSQSAEQPDPQPTEAATGGTDEQEIAQAEEVDSIDDAYSDSDYEEGEGDDSEQEPERYIVKADGEELEVTLDELVSGYQRDSDYRKKTMTLAEQRKEVEAEKGRLGDIVQQIDSFIKREQSDIDWEKLRTEDPEQYIAKQDELKQAEALKQQALDEQQKHYQQIVQRESKALIDAMGGDDVWSIEDRKADYQAAQDYLKAKGMDEREITGIVDHRLWRVFIEAAKSEKLRDTQARVKQEVRKAPKSVKPGQKVEPSERKRLQATNQLKKAASSRRGATANDLAEFLKSR